jgi:predicted Zn-dependent protease
MHDAAARAFWEALPTGSFWASLRILQVDDAAYVLRKGVLQPPGRSRDRGGMITVREGGGLGYAATSDLSAQGLRRAIDRARAWAQATRRSGVIPADRLSAPKPQGRWQTPIRTPFAAVPLSDRLGALREAAAALPQDDRLVDWEISLLATQESTRLIDTDGADAEQEIHLLGPDLSVVTHRAGLTQQRSSGGRNWLRQGGWEAWLAFDLPRVTASLADEALALLDAPPCPDEVCSLLLDPDQMVLQIHESIGHPLELDRILGDERNYAGTSFVRPEDIGELQYGSPLLNVAFDPSDPQEMATYRWDDDGHPASRALIIEDGRLVRALGSALSQARSGLPGVANARASGWNRPPIDRMANLDLLPGATPLPELIRRVERGVWMRTNRSWSIDDRRDKFQFGCELGYLIRDGEVGPLVRNPGYRGRAAAFWHSLVGVGDAASYQVGGSPFCGKGEPNQMVRVGHGSPPCLFANVDVFGGA